MALVTSPVLAATPQFDGGPTVSTEAGNTLLAWQSDGPVRLELASDDAFSDARVIYAGSAHSYFLSGLADGDYRLRLRTQDGGTSPSLTVSVRHQSLSRALWLVAIGAFVTLLVIGAVLRGARDE